MVVDAKLRILAVLLGAIGCGGTHSTPRDAGRDRLGRDVASEDTGDGARDARGMDEEAACSSVGWDAGPAAVAPRDQGLLVLAQVGDFGGTSGVFSASFSRGGQPVTVPPLPLGDGTREIGPAVCDLGTFGPCIVTTTACAIRTPPCGAPQAGKLTFGSPDQLSDTTSASSPNPNGSYTSDNLLELGGGQVFVPGTPQAVQATGGDLPPFLLQVIAPGCIALSRPAMLPLAADAAPFSPRYTIARDQDLALAWTGGESDATVGLDLYSTSKYGDVVDVSCSFPAAGGQGTIPHQALSALEAGPVGDLSVYQQTSVSRQVGTFEVEFAVRNFGGGDSAPDGGTCPVNNGRVTFQ